MYQLKTQMSVALTSLILVACSSFNSSREFSYHDSALDDRNRAPAALMPPATFSEQGAKIDPAYNQSQADFNYSMGEAASLEGSPQKAIEFFKTALIYDSTATSVKLRLASEQLRLGQLSEALALTQEVVREKPQDQQGLFLMAALYSSLKLYHKAIEYYQKVLVLNPENEDANLYLGALYAETKQFDKAVLHFEKMLAATEDQEHTIHYYLARVHLESEKAGSNKKVEFHLQRAIDKKPSFIEALMTLGAYYASLGQEEKGLKLYEDYQKKYGPSVKVAEVLAQTYLEIEDYDAAYEQLEILEAQGEDQLNTKLKMALILVEKKMYEPSSAKLKEILREVPDSDRARFYLAAIYEQTKQVDQAVAEYGRIPADSSYFNDSVIHSAYLLKSEKRLSDAVELVEKSMKKKESEASFYSLYASLLNEQKKANQAVKIMEDAKSKFPQNTQVLFYLGTLYDAVGNKEQLVKTMQSVLEKDPQHVQALNYVAYTWADGNENLEQAESYARKAVELEPKDGYILDTLGWVLFKQGKYSEALKYLEAAHKVAPHVPIIAEHLGDVYVKQAMIEKAKNMYGKAMAIETEKDKLESIRVKLTSIEPVRDRQPAAAP
jgi:tetratricopeptide (TPR) repeat protein